MPTDSRRNISRISLMCMVWWEKNDVTRSNSIRILFNGISISFPSSGWFLCSHFVGPMHSAMALGGLFPPQKHTLSTQIEISSQNQIIVGNYGGISIQFMSASISLATPSSVTLSINAFERAPLVEPITHNTTMLFLFILVSRRRHYTQLSHLTFIAARVSKIAMRWAGEYQLTPQKNIPNSIPFSLSNFSFVRVRIYHWIHNSNKMNSSLSFPTNKWTKLHPSPPSHPHEDDCWNGNNKTLQPLMLMNNPRDGPRRSTRWWGEKQFFSCSSPQWNF